MLLFQKHRIPNNFPLDFLLKKGKVGAFFIIYLIKKCLQVYLTLSKDNFILVNVISMLASLADSLRVRHAFLPQERLLKRATHSFPIAK